MENQEHEQLGTSKPMTDPQNEVKEHSSEELMVASNQNTDQATAPLQGEAPFEQSAPRTGSSDHGTTDDANHADAFIANGSTVYDTSTTKKRKFPFWQIGVSALGFGLIAAIVFQLTSFGLSKLLKNSNNVKIVTTYSAPADLTSESQVSDIVEQLMPAMVSINVVSTVHASNGIFSYEYQATGAGSGVIVGKTENSLYILTNYHVIESAKSIAVSFVDETAYYVSVKGYDEATDLAVLEINCNDMKDSTLQAIAIAVLGTSKDIRLGEQVVAIGNALGYGQTVTVGYISALDRSITDEDGYTKSMIQTDAAINAGNSGGALINARGELIGINSMKNITENTDNIGYAIPIDLAKTILEDILTRTQYSGLDCAYLGVSGIAVSDYWNYQKTDMPLGVYIRSTVDNCPAANAGVLVGDIISALDGKQIIKMETLQHYLTFKTTGDTVTLTVNRLQNNGEYLAIDLTVTLISKRDAGLTE